MKEGLSKRFRLTRRMVCLLTLKFRLTPRMFRLTRGMSRLERGMFRLERGKLRLLRRKLRIKRRKFRLAPRKFCLTRRDFSLTRRECCLTRRKIRVNNRNRKLSTATFPVMRYTKYGSKRSGKLLSILLALGSKSVQVTCTGNLISKEGSTLFFLLTIW